MDHPEQTSSAACEPPVYPVDPFTFVLHGASGDLARRKILPALAHLAQGGYFPAECRIILSQRQAVTPSDALAEQDAFLREIGDEAACRETQKPPIEARLFEKVPEMKSTSPSTPCASDTPRPVSP